MKSSLNLLAAALIGFGARRRSMGGLLIAAGAAPLVYRGATGRWPAALESLTGMGGDTRQALSGPRGINLRESIRLEDGAAPALTIALDRGD